MTSSQPSPSLLVEHYKAIGREEKAAAIRTWLNAVKAELEKDRAKAEQNEYVYAVDMDDLRSAELETAELRGGIAIINVLLERMNEASDADPGTKA